MELQLVSQYTPLDMPGWVDVDGYEGLYQVHAKGFVRNAVTGLKLKAGLGSVGYPTVVLVKNKQHKTYTVHRLVAKAFIPNPDNKEMVNHKNGNKVCNHFANLEWVTRSENEKHAYDIGLKARTRKFKGIRQLSLDGALIKEYKSSIEAKLDGYNLALIRMTCNGNKSHYRGFKWSWINQ